MLAHRVPRGKRQPSIVTLIRIAPRKLDEDNLRSALKAVQDSVATWIAPRVDSRGRMSGDDGENGPITFRHGQRKGAPREYGVEILIEPRVDGWIVDKEGDAIRVEPRGSDAARAWISITGVGVGINSCALVPSQLRALIVQCEIALKGIA
jgi:hypothetical protein